MGKQDSGRGAGFVPGILIDDSVDHAAEQKSSGIGGQFMRDPDDILRSARRFKRSCDALVAGTCIVEANQIGVLAEHGRSQRAIPFAVVAPLARR